MIVCRISISFSRRIRLRQGSLSRLFVKRVFGCPNLSVFDDLRLTSLVILRGIAETTGCSLSAS